MNPWSVYVLCAGWCGTCRDYRTFVDAKQQEAAARWVWVDIEENSDALGDLDIENFPTLLVTEGDEVRFLGTITPQPEVANRLIESLQSGNRYPVDEVDDMPGIVKALQKVSGPL